MSHARRRLTFLSAVSLVLCIGVVSLSVAGLFHVNAIELNHNRWDGTELTGFEVAIWHDARGMVLYLSTQSSGPGGEVENNPVLADWKRSRPEGYRITREVFDAREITGWWFRYGSNESNEQLGLDRYVRQLTMPFWVLFVLFAVLPARWFILCRKRSSEHACPSCGYDLRASPERCPECGASRIVP